MYEIIMIYLKIVFLKLNSITNSKLIDQFSPWEFSNDYRYAQFQALERNLWPLIIIGIFHKDDIIQSTWTIHYIPFNADASFDEGVMEPTFRIQDFLRNSFKGLTKSRYLGLPFDFEKSNAKWGMEPHRRNCDHLDIQESKYLSKNIKNENLDLDTRLTSLLNETMQMDSRPSRYLEI